MNKKIIYLVSEDWYFLSHRLTLAKNAMDRGYIVHVICKDTGMINEIKKHGFKYCDAFANYTENNYSLFMEKKLII